MYIICTHGENVSNIAQWLSIQWQNYRLCLIFIHFQHFKMCYYKHIFYNKIQVNKHFNMPIEIHQQVEKQDKVFLHLVQILILGVSLPF